VHFAAPVPVPVPVPGPGPVVAAVAAAAAAVVVVAVPVAVEGMPGAVPQLETLAPLLRLLRPKNSSSGSAVSSGGGCWL